MLNPTLTLTLVLRAKHNDVFHCLYEGKFLVSLSIDSRCTLLYLGLARLFRDARFNPSSPQTNGYDTGEPHFPSFLLTSLV